MNLTIDQERPIMHVLPKKLPPELECDPYARKAHEIVSEWVKQVAEQADPTTALMGGPLVVHLTPDTLASMATDIATALKDAGEGRLI